MRQSKLTETQIVSILKEADAGRPVNELWRQHGISSATYYKWKAKYSGLETSDVKRLKELRHQNNRLKRMYADLSLESAYTTRMKCLVLGSTFQKFFLCSNVPVIAGPNATAFTASNAAATYWRKILLEEFLKAFNPPMNANILAQALEVPPNRITVIIKGQRGIMGHTTVRLVTHYNNTAEFWMN